MVHLLLIQYRYLKKICCNAKYDKLVVTNELRRKLILEYFQDWLANYDILCDYINI